MQLSEMREYCSRRGWAVAREFVDHGWSGKRADRPELGKLMLMADARKFDAVLVWKLDRFGRSVVDLKNNISALELAGVRFIAISQGIDTDHSNPTSRFMLNMLAAVAEFEAEIIRERVKAGVEQAKRNGTRSGKAIGRPQRVFRRDEVIRLRGEGVSWREISRRLEIGEGTARRACAKTPSAVSRKRK